MAIEFDLGDLKGFDCILTCNLFHDQIVIEFFDRELWEDVRLALNKTRMPYDCPSLFYVRIMGEHQQIPLPRIAQIVADGIESSGHAIAKQLIDEGRSEYVESFDRTTTEVNHGNLA